MLMLSMYVAGIISLVHHLTVAQGNPVHSSDTVYFSGLRNLQLSLGHSNTIG